MTVSVCLYVPLLSNPYQYKYDCVCLSLTRICISMTVSVCLYVSNPYLYKYDCVCLSLRPPPL